ncbi:MAG: thiamine phosphate synthase [Mariprofundaceae bacterium]|nr:thiamine phosphate synthase [Mariprofundaceae bacterium]
MSRSGVSGIYGILPADLETQELLKRAEAALKGGVKTLQFRDKKQGFKVALKRGKALKALTARYGAKLIVNDSIQLAHEIEADGVHLGRGDIEDLALIRQNAGEGLILGVTCRADASFGNHAIESGADYLSFGAVFPTTTKPEVPAIGLPRLQKAINMFPDANIVAIGGIGLEAIGAVKSTGVDSVAVISALFAADKVESTARAMVEAWEGA